MSPVPPRTPKPRWLTRKLPSGPQYERIRQLLKSQCLHTVCQEAKCPNQFECFGKGAATFMILGDHCSRDCRFCAVAHGLQGPPEVDEPRRVAYAVQTMQLSYCVITSVTRDDLPDGGAAHFAATIQAVRALNPRTLVEVLIPDLQGDTQALATVLAAHPAVLNHNLETVAPLYDKARPQAVYQRSLAVLQQSKQIAPEIVSKCGIMVGLGETREQLVQLMRDLRSVHCEILTIGQYLQPSSHHLPVERYVPPEEFAELAQVAQDLGFAAVASAPFVRSSYQAESLYTQAMQARVPHLSSATPHAQS